MKIRKIIILTIMLIAIACKAQYPVVSLDAKRFNTPDGAYFKDMNNEFNKFEGTWAYINGNTSLVITLIKVEQVEVNNDYRDFIFGEYRYVENGVELINTLPALNLNPNDIDSRNIGGGYIIPTHLYASCDDCLPNERRVKLYFKDPERSYLSTSIILRYLVGQKNPEKMTATIISESGGVLPSADSPATMRIPLGEYLMVKQ